MANPKKRYLVLTSYRFFCPYVDKIELFTLFATTMSYSTYLSHSGIYQKFKNTDLKNSYRQIDGDEQGWVTFEIEKGRLSFRLPAPYSDERNKQRVRGRDKADLSKTLRDLNTHLNITASYTILDSAVQIFYKSKNEYKFFDNIFIYVYSVSFSYNII